jgi:hypothetical protein
MVQQKNKPAARRSTVLLAKQQIARYATFIDATGLQQ